MIKIIPNLNDDLIFLHLSYLFFSGTNWGIKHICKSNSYLRIRLKFQKLNVIHYFSCNKYTANIFIVYNQQ